MMKKISIVIPTFFEQDNIIPLTDAIVAEMNKMPQYDYEILFIDNDSKDQTRNRICEVCKTNVKCCAIFNAKNFGGIYSPIYGLLQARGDCAILMCADFQDPVEMIPTLIQEWESGHSVVCGVKTHSDENFIMYKIRSIYYWLIDKCSDINQIQHFTGFGLYDRSFLELIRSLDDPTPFLRGIVAEYACDRKDIEYTQKKRRTGKTSTNFYWLYNVAMLSFTSYTKVGLRFITFIGFGGALISFILAIFYLMLKLFNWNDFAMGISPALVGIFFIGSFQLASIGFLGEYVMSINERILHKPLVIEKIRIGFDLEKTDEQI